MGAIGIFLIPIGYDACYTCITPENPMLAIRLPPEIEQRLDALAKRTRRSKSHYVRTALTAYLDELEGSRIAEPAASYAQGSRSAKAGRKAAMQLTAVLMPAKEGGFVALNPETGSASQGESISEALVNLREATELYLEEFPVKSFGKALMTTFDVPGNGT